MMHFQVHLLSVGIFLEQQCFTLLMLHGKELFGQQVRGVEDVFTKSISEMLKELFKRPYPVL